MKTAWNTGAWYTDKGQRIAAEYCPATEEIRFVDIDRMIDGIAYSLIEPASEADLRRLATDAYNRGGYTGWTDYSDEGMAQRAALGELAGKVPGNKR